MMAIVLKDRVRIQARVATQTATGETVVWKPVETLHACVIPLDARAQAAYQQLQSQVSHKVIFRGDVSLALGDNRLLWKDKTLTLAGPTQSIEGNTVVAVKEA